MPDCIVTPRQLQIVSLMARGECEQAIALKLGITWQTVKNHMYALYERIGATSGAQAVAMLWPSLGVAPVRWEMRCPHQCPKACPRYCERR